MAMSSDQTNAEAMSAGRRFAIGANVAISIFAAAALLVAVNWIGSVKSVREDLADRGAYGLSDRTKSVLASCDEDIRVWTIYPEDPEEPKQQEYIDRLNDYCDELDRFSDKVKISHIATDSQRERLVSEIRETFGGEATGHQEALERFESLRASLEVELSQRLNEARALLENESWLADFPIFTEIARLFGEDVETLKSSAEEIKQLTPQGGIPRYADATQAAGELLEKIRNNVTAVQERMSRLAALAEETSRPDSTYIAMLREVGQEPEALVQSLRATIGDADEAEPSDISAALKAFADRSVEVSKALDAIVRKVDQFASKFPTVQEHRNWAARVAMGPLTMRMDVGSVLDQSGKTLEETRLVILGVIDNKDPAELRQALAAVRKDLRVLEGNASSCRQLLVELADRLAAVDEASNNMLELARQGQLFGDLAAKIGDLKKQFDELPELKLGSVADELREDNVVIIQATDRLRVIGFSEMFVPIESVRGPGEEIGRTFNGDSAMASAILALTQEKPFATVVLTAFEPPPPQQRQQFMPPPPPSVIPLDSLTELRQRLEGANFKVIDWNMAVTPDAPPADEGTERIFILLPPPPPAPPNPFGGQQPQNQMFGEAQRQKIRDLLNENARMVFLASWEVRQGGGFMGAQPITPPYGYGPLLQQDWGIVVENGNRLVWVEPDRKNPDTFSLNQRNFFYLPITGFTRHPVAEPLLGARFLVADACTITLVDSPPEGVQHEPIVTVPQREQYISADLSALIDIINQIRQPSADGRLHGDFPHGPFDLCVAAERKQGEEMKGRIIVSGFGGSLRDGYITSPVPVGDAALRFDPAPTENIDLMNNALYWLSGKSDLIASGPTPLPRIRPIPDNELTAIRVVVWAVLPLIVFVPGVVLWFIRRR
jgi:hypothetical protein